MTSRRTVAAAVAVATVLLSLSSSVPGRYVPPAVDTPAATVTVHGRDGTFGAFADTVPSGQTAARRPVPGWGFPPGVQAGRLALAGDGTVFVAGVDYHAGLRGPTGRELVVGAYDPAANAFATVGIHPTTGGRRAVTADGGPAAPSIADLVPIAGGRAMAFTSSQPLGQAIGPGGRWPVFGVLTKVDGRWRVDSGRSWSNEWTGADLRRSSVDLGQRACPEDVDAPGRRDCRGLGAMAVLPHSRDLIVAQYFGAAGERNGALTALRVTGPDRDGRFEVRITGHHPYPKVGNLRIAPWSVRADPTSPAGAERFVVGFAVESEGGDPAPSVVQEFSYDAATGVVRPASAPLIPGDRTADGSAFYAYGATLYDAHGNLWVARGNGLQGGKLAVYTRGRDGRRTLDRPECAYARAEVTAAEVEEVDAAAIADERVGVWRPLARQAGVRLLRAGPAHTPVRAAAQVLDQALDALLSNAVKFAGGGAEVVVNVTQEQAGWVEVHVIDNGPGMPPEDLARAAEAFWRRPSDQNVDGSGLGVTIADSLVAASGGRLDLMPANPHGVHARIRLPAARPAHPALTGAPPQAAGSHQTAAG